MTEEEKIVERNTKGIAVASIPDLREKWERWSSMLNDTDPRLGIYMESVWSDPAGHNLYEHLAISRFLEMLECYRWNRKRVKRFFKLYESLRFTGVGGRRRYKLTPIQCFQFGNIFGFDDAEGLRLCRLAYIFVPRKFSKTTAATSLAVNDFYFGDYNAQAYVGANSYNQAKICFDEIRNIIQDIEGRSRAVKVNRERITFTTSERAASIECLAANAKTRDGLNASLAIIDEYAQARNTAGANGADLKNVLTSSMGARREPLTVIISTASEVVDGPFAHEIKGAKSILRGECKNDRMFASIFQPDVDDEEGDPATWRKVQPHIGITIQKEFYENAWSEAQLSPENMLTFRTKLLNIFCVNSRSSWIDENAIQSAIRHLDISKIKGTPISTVSFDLSVREDFSAVTYGIYYPNEKNFYYHTAYFMPRASLETHANRRLYKKWADEGHLILCDGEVIDYRAICDYILGINGHSMTIAIGYDPAKSGELLNMLKAAGAEAVLNPVRQTYIEFTAPVESFEVGIRTGHIFLDNNPITAYCFGNAMLDHDKMENMKPTKKYLNGKIDGVITCLMCHKMFMMNTQLLQLE